jgi:ATP-dependent exoDNAse (exonuclease V) alpha subunit
MGKPDEIEKKFNKFRDKTIWIDEFSMFGSLHWNIVSILIIDYNVKFILSGDEEQLQPINGTKISLNNVIIKAIFGETIDLTRQDNYRQTEKILNISRAIRRGDVEAIKDIPYEKDPFFFKRHLCFYNNTRRYINKKIMDLNCYTYDVKNKKCSIGVILKCNVNTEDLCSGERYICISEGKIQSLKTGKIINLVHSYFDVSFATTIHSSQGSTINEKTILWDIEVMKLNKNLLYSGISRIDNFENISISAIESLPIEKFEYNNFKSSKFLQDKKHYI